MIALLLGCASLLVLMGALGMFSKANIATIKQFGIWVAAIGGLLLAALLFLTGRAPTAIAALVMLGPLVWSWVGPGLGTPGSRPGPSKPGAAKPGSQSGNASPGPRPRGGMTSGEALEVLGLKQGASRTDIQTSYVRLMQAAHPDHGGSDWLAARINQARDILLG